MSEKHIDQFHAPAGPPGANALNMLSGTAVLVAGTVDIDLSAKGIPLASIANGGPTFTVSHIDPWVNAAVAAPLNWKWNIGTGHLTINAAVNTDVNNVMWTAWW